MTKQTAVKEKTAEEKAAEEKARFDAAVTRLEKTVNRLPNIKEMPLLHRQRPLKIANECKHQLGILIAKNKNEPRLKKIVDALLEKWDDRQPPEVVLKAIAQAEYVQKLERTVETLEKARALHAEMLEDLSEDKRNTYEKMVAEMTTAGISVSSLKSFMWLYYGTINANDDES